jgi:hypothetical protein
VTTLIQPFPPRAKFVNPDGTPTPAAIRWVQFVLLPRVGGAIALSNKELEEAVLALQTSVASILAGEMVIQPIPADRIFPDVMQTAPSIDLGEMTWQT